MHDLPYEWVRPDGNPHRPDYCNCLPISVFWEDSYKIRIKPLNSKIRIKSARILKSAKSVIFIKNLE
jgi:hypothetical protein